MELRRAGPGQVDGIDVREEGRCASSRSVWSDGRKDVKDLCRVSVSTDTKTGTTRRTEGKGGTSEDK